MKTKSFGIETKIWVDQPEKEGYLKYAGQRKAKDVFEELKNYLEKIKLLPEEYFSLNFKLAEKEFPQYYRLAAYANYGSSEGIYLDIDLYTEGEDGKVEIIHFATGKTLSTADYAMNRMYRAACETIKVFGGQGKVYPRYVKVEEKGVPLSENDYSVIINSLIHLRNTLKDDNSEYYMVDSVLDKLCGNDEEKTTAQREEDELDR